MRIDLRDYGLEPDSGRSAAYEPYYNLYRSLYPALREQFGTLASLE